MSHFRKKLLLEISIAIVAVGALYAGTTFFRRNIVKATERSVAGKQSVESRARSVERLAELRAEEKTATPYLNILYNVLPQKDGLINFSREMQSIATSEGLSFTFSFAGESNPDTENLGAVSFVIGVSGGSFTQVTNFIRKIQTYRYLIRIDNVSIMDSGNRAVIRGVVFFR